MPVITTILNAQKDKTAFRHKGKAAKQSQYRPGWAQRLPGS